MKNMIRIRTLESGNCSGKCIMILPMLEEAGYFLEAADAYLQAVKRYNHPVTKPDTPLFIIHSHFLAGEMFIRCKTMNPPAHLRKPSGFMKTARNLKFGKESTGLIIIEVTFMPNRDRKKKP
ncbi:MAG: hypothetical protein Ct9H90mP8_2630 [Pseudomonadota bacterium]|nr:MAG: hypothetical protein Ct9H90mP8_2630 [Pseudomonadota bacterium]